MYSVEKQISAPKEQSVRSEEIYETNNNKMEFY